MVHCYTGQIFMVFMSTFKNFNFKSAFLFILLRLFKFKIGLVKIDEAPVFIFTYNVY